MTALEPIAWIALVARWTELARASRAIPAENTRLRDSVAPLIAIEANTAALGELARVQEADRPHARDLAEISIRSAASELDRLWRGEEWPEEFLAACEAAERALRHGVYAGLEELVVTGSGVLEVPDLGLGFEDAGEGLRGTVAAMPPGSLAMPGEPVVWWCGRPAPRCEHPRLARGGALAPRQVYRQLDGRGRFVADRMRSIEDEPCAGLPMLTPLLLDGHRVGRFLHSPADWGAMQRIALGDRDAIPITE